MKKLLLAITLLILCVVTVHATSWQCMLNGGSWVNNHCIYPITVPVPTSIIRDELVEGELNTAFLTLGEDSYNTVLAQYETITIGTQYDLKFTEPVNISISIGTPGEDGFLLYINEQGDFTLRPSWTYWNKTLITAQTFLPETLISTLFSWYKGWLFTGVEIQSYNNPQYYWIQYYWVYIANPNI